MVSSEILKGLFRLEALKKHKLAQFVKILYRRSMAVCSERKLVTGPVIIEKIKSFYYEMKIADKCIFSKGWL